MHAPRTHCGLWTNSTFRIRIRIHFVILTNFTHTHTQKDGLALPVERHSFSGGNLTITNLVETDRGIYECSATNEAATITAEAELMIENTAPRPPYNLTANSTETCITIRWQPGEQH